jgi:hypothetical protein
MGCLKKKKEEEEGEDEKHYGGLEREEKNEKLKERRSRSGNGVRERIGTGMVKKNKAEGVERRLRQRGAWDRKGKSRSGLESDRNGKGDGKK